MTRTGPDAEAYARSRVGTKMPDAGLCLQFTRQNYAVGAVYGSALDAWTYAKSKHAGARPPAGSVVPVYWATPSPYDHVAILMGNGQVVTTNDDRIELWSSIDSISSGFRGTYLGWAEDINTVRVYPHGSSSSSTSPDDDGETMKYKGSQTAKPFKLTPKQWTTLRISDDGDMSILTGPAVFTAVAQVTVSGLPPGSQLGVRFKTVDVKSGSDTKRVSSYPTTEIVGTGGDTEGTAAQVGSIGTPAKGWSRRLRVELMTYSEGVTVTKASARVGY